MIAMNQYWQIAALFIVLLILGVIFSAEKRAEERKKAEREKTFTDPEIIPLLKSKSGVIFGKKSGETIGKPENSDGHIMVIGGVGSGKSSCVAIPSLLAWKSQVFAIDIKGELYAQTKNKRRKIKVFAPMSENSLGYNPFHLLDWTDNPAQEARAIAHALIPIPAETKDTFWLESAQNMLTGAILHCYNLGFSFVETITKIQSTPIEQLIAEIKRGNTEAAYFINNFVGMDLKTLAGIYSELSRHILLYITDKKVRNCLSKDDCITPEDLEKGADVFIIIPEHLLTQWKNLLTLMISQFLTHFEQRPDLSATPILFLLDEFARLGKIAGITDGLATLRSKKISICIILQSLAQLDLIYGRDTRKIIFDICAYKAIFGATDTETQEVFSKAVGTYDRPKPTNSKNYDRFGFKSGSSTSETTEEKRIIKPEDFATLKDIVLLTPFGFFRVEKKPYF
jgi:type IV secretion system protein VirD4